MHMYIVNPFIRLILQALFAILFKYSDKYGIFELIYQMKKVKIYERIYQRKPLKFSTHTRCIHLEKKSFTCN